MKIRLEVGTEMRNSGTDKSDLQGTLGLISNIFGLKTEDFGSSP